MLNLSDDDLLFKTDPDVFSTELQEAIEESRKKLKALEKEAGGGRTPANLVPRMEVLLSRPYRLTGYLTTLDILDSKRFGKARADASEKLTHFEGSVLGSRILARPLKEESDRSRLLQGGWERLFESPPTLSGWLYLERFQDRMRNHGAYLPTETKQKEVLTLHEKLNASCNQYMANIKGGQEQQALLYTEEKYLDGVPPARKNAYHKKALEVAELLKANPQCQWSRFAERLAHADKDKIWIVMPERLEVESLLPVARNADFRIALIKAYKAVGLVPPFDNRPVMKEALICRQQLADLLSPPSREPKNYTRLATARSIIPNALTAPHTPYDLVRAILSEGLPRFNRDVERITNFAATDARLNGRRFSGKLEDHNFLYYAQKFFEARGFNDEQLSQYMGVETVLANLSKVLERDFDISLVEDTESEQRFTKERGYAGLKVYDVLKTVDGKKNLLPTKLCFDLFARPETGKREPAWTAYVPGMAFVVMTLNKSERGQTLLTLCEYVALFHELGHALGCCMSEHGDPRAFLADVERVEAFSGILEYRAPDYLKGVARHHLTGKAPPDGLLEKTRDYCTFLQRHQTLRRAYIGWRDLQMHRLWINGTMKSEEATYGWHQYHWYKDWFSHDKIEDVPTARFHQAIASSIDWPSADNYAPYKNLKSCLIPFPLTHWLHFATQSPPYAAGFYSYLLGPIMWATLEQYKGEEKKYRTIRFFEDAFGTFPIMSFLHNLKLHTYMKALDFDKKELEVGLPKTSTGWRDYARVRSGNPSPPQR